MKLVKCNINELGLNSYSKTRNQELIDEFMNSGMNCARVDGWTHKSVSSCQSSLKRTIENCKYHGVKVTSRKGEVYLIRVDHIEDK